MKIIQLTSSVYPINIGGMEMHVYNLSRELSNSHSIEILTRTGRYYVKPNGEMVLTEKMSLITILRYILIKDYDILHIHNWGIMPLGLFKNEFILVIAKLRRKKVILTPYGFIDIIPCLSEKSWKTRFYFRATKEIFRCMDAFIGIHPQQEEIMIQKFGIPKSKISFIPTGISDLAFNNTNVNSEAFIAKHNLNGKFTVCFVGRLAPNKRLSDLVEVMNKLCFDFNRKDIVVLIAGPDGGDKAYLTKLINEKCLEEYVKLIGEIGEEEKFLLMNIATVFISPSSSEAFGISTCEAMSQGTPIISASNLGANYLLANGKYGMLYGIGNVEELLTAIQWIFNNPDEAKIIGERGKKRASEFRWNKMAAIHNHLYRQIFLTSR